MNSFEEVKDTTQYIIQENQYTFPYHYLPSLNGFRYHFAKTRLIGYEYLSYIHFAINKLGIIETYLDIGCGDGRIVHEVKKKFPHAIVKGIDLSSRSIAFAKAFNNDNDFVSGDVTTKDIFNGQKFRTATCIEVIEHIPPDLLDGFITGIAYHLEEAGLLVVTVPSSNVPVSKKHYQHFTIDRLNKYLNSHFNLIEFFYVNKIHWTMTWLCKLMENKYFILNHQPTLNRIYRYYEKNLFFGNQENTRRIAAIYQKK
jgi:2-polyprenyl-3-methyl-5-hydroxy-6-metoxy-1,4-benzoquinol methylase